MDAALPVVFLAIMGASLVLYVVLDGYDLGIGLLLPLASDREKDTMIAAIGPFWDANETWLVLGVGVLLIAFPAADALDPAGVRVHRDAHHLVAVAGEHGFDRLDRLEDGEVGRLPECRDAIEEYDNFHVELRSEISTTGEHADRFTATPRRLLVRSRRPARCPAVPRRE